MRVVSKTSSGKSRPKPEPNNTPPVVRADELYVADEFYRRCRWRKHSIREAKRMGLPTIRFGSRDYVIGKQALEWFEQLGEQQNQDPP